MNWTAPTYAQRQEIGEDRDESYEQRQARISEAVASWLAWYAQQNDG